MCAMAGVQLSLFATPEQIFAERICDEFNKIDTVFKSTFYVDTCKLERWNHVDLKERVLFVSLKSPLNSTENSFVQFGGDRQSQLNLYNCGLLNEWIGERCQDRDLSINITPWSIYVYYHNFERKQIE